MPRTVIQVIAALVVSVFAIGIWATGGHANAGWLRFYAVAVLVVTAALGAWDRVLWKIPAVQRSRRVPRNVGGTWRGTLTSTWVDESKSGEPIAPKPAYLVVRQTATSVLAILLTDESRSISTLGKVSGGAGTASLDYMYLNRPDSRVEHRSRMHHGSTALDITGTPANRLKGRYWTDRDTKGELDFVDRHKHVAEDYEEAAALFA